MPNFKRLGTIKTREEFLAYLEEKGVGNLPVDESILSEEENTPMARPWALGDVSLSNRWVIHAMEGWDAEKDGRPSDLVLGRWKKFGDSGASLIWGGEAFAVRDDGRANPRQLCYRPEHVDTSLPLLFDTVTQAHRERLQREGKSPDESFLVGLQLTHSGRFSKSPSDTMAPKIAYHHPVLDARVKIDPNDDSCILTDGDIHDIIDRYVTVAKHAWKAGFHFVDVKHCHGYFAHELLHAVDRSGPYGGPLENRTRFAREIIDGIRTECPGLKIGVRLSLFDAIPGHEGNAAPGAVRDVLCDEDFEIVRVFAEELKIDVLNITAASPYYSVYAQRPSMTPALEAMLIDGRLQIPDNIEPPEDPLLGCCRQIFAAREVKRRFPNLPMIGSAYTYFQEFLPQVAQGVVRNGWIDAVGIGRMVLPYGDIIADTLAGRPLDRRRICRTFSDCTTGPRNGMVSGCYPLDPVYKITPEAARMRELKRKS